MVLKMQFGCVEMGWAAEDGVENPDVVDGEARSGPKMCMTVVDDVKMLLQFKWMCGPGHINEKYLTDLKTSQDWGIEEQMNGKSCPSTQ